MDAPPRIREFYVKPPSERTHRADRPPRQRNTSVQRAYKRVTDAEAVKVVRD